jgi:protein ImuB
MSPEPVRVLALWSPDWPVTAAARAAHIPPHRPAAVIAANRVLACSAVARAHGIRRGLRRREAQARCPELAVLTRDPDRDARAFEPVVVAVEELAPGVEIVRPGLVVLPARGPAGYFDGELAAAERLVDQVAARTGVECQVGVADGLFAAVLAARRGLAVGPGDTPAFLAPLGVEELDRDPALDRSELVGLLRRLGLRSLGAFGTLDPEDVASRFGADAVLCHRLARGLDPRPPVRRRPPEELPVEIELDPPVDRVDAAAFAARGLAERLHRTLAGHGLSCTRLGVAARTVSGDQLHRVWRCAEPLTPAGTVDRVRWQLDAWLTRRQVSAADRPGAVSRLWLVPEETVTAGALQLGLWGGVGEADERAARALVRVQALLGPESVCTAVLGGGRDPGERVRLVPWGDERADGAGPESGELDRGVAAAADGPVAAAPARSAPIGAVEPALLGSVPPGRLTLLPDLDDPGAPTGNRPAPVRGPRSGDSEPPTTGNRRDRGTGEPPAGDPRPPTVDSGGPAGDTGPGPAGPPGPPPPPQPPTGGRGRPAPGPGASDPDLERAMAPLDDTGRIAPAGWPPDVIRRTGRISALDVLAASTPNGAPDHAEPGADGQRAPEPARPRPTNRRRRPPARRSTPTPTRPEPPAPWPGRLPAPSPATVPPEPLRAELLDAEGRPVWLTAPERLSAPPHLLAVDGGAPRDVEGWAGPWPTRQRWWSPDGVTSSRLQLLCPDGAAFLLASRDGRWWITGSYD